MDNEKIIRYLEGQLSGTIKEEFETLIESNSEIKRASRNFSQLD